MRSVFFCLSVCPDRSAVADPKKTVSPWFFSTAQNVWHLILRKAFETGFSASVKDLFVEPGEIRDETDPPASLCKRGKNQIP